MNKSSSAKAQERSPYLVDHFYKGCRVLLSDQNYNNANYEKRAERSAHCHCASAKQGGKPVSRVFSGILFAEFISKQRMFNEFFVTQVSMTPFDACVSMTSRWFMPVSTTAHVLYPSSVFKEAGVLVMFAFLG